MNVKLIRSINGQEFLNDLKLARQIMAYVPSTGSFFCIRKMELVKEAESKTISYYLTDQIFVAKRTVMVII